MPFITEEVWQRFGIGDSIVISEWPEPHPDLRDRDAERTFSFAEDLVLAVRSFRSGHGLTPGTALTVRVRAVGDQRDVLVTLDQEIRRVARIERLEPIEGDGDASGHARLMVQGAEVLIPLAGVLDPAAECARLRKRLGGIAAGAERAARKLDDRGFIEKAPADVVEKERAKLVSLEGERAVLEAQLVELGC
jgi:valyl-tRNA synthetase